jgi:MFS family permease
MSVQAPAAPPASSVEVQVPPSAADAPVQPWPGAGKAWWCVIMLSIVLMLSQIDRNIITLLVRPIKQDLRLSDVQISLLLGPAFIVLYVFMGLPLSRISDTRSRRVMITIGLTLWSLMTAACGLAQGFGQLFLARVGIGAGESVNGPATYSMLADYFPRERLPRALAALNIGFVLGTGFSLIAGGLVIGALMTTPEHTVPILGVVKSWQLVFIAVGLPGLVFAALMMTVTEPPRRGLGGARPVAPPVREVAAFLGRNGRMYGGMIGGILMMALLVSGTQNWSPVFYERTYGWQASQVGVALGIMNLIASPIGLFLGAWLTERLARRHDDANMRVAILAYALAIPFQIAGPLMPSPYLAVFCSGVGILAAMMATTPYVAAMQTITPNQMRAQVSAIYLFVFSGLGSGLGSLLFGAVTDLIVKDEANIRFTLAGAAAVMAPLGVLIISLARKPYGEAIAAIKAAEGGLPRAAAGSAGH